MLDAKHFMAFPNDRREEASTKRHHTWSGRMPGRERTQCVVPSEALSDVDIAFIRSDEEVGYLPAIHGQLRRYEGRSEAEI